MTDISLLGLLEETEPGREMLQTLQEHGDPDKPVIIPDIDHAALLLAQLGAPEEDVQDALEARSRIVENQNAVWLLEHHVHRLRTLMGQPDAELMKIVDFPNEAEYFNRFLWLYGYLAAVPDIRAYHQTRGIPDDISWATLGDVGRNMRVQRKRTGTSGLAATYWPSLHFRGLLYQLGRLQFEITPLRSLMVPAIQDAGFDVEASELVLSVHIPDFMGGFPPEACDASLASARTFFPQYFPEHHFRFAVCHSWLLDDQLPDHLPPQSNIVKFNQRFHIAAQSPRDNAGAGLFVWGQPGIRMDRFDNGTSLERALIAHVRNGGQWGGGSGWFHLAWDSNR